MKGRRGEWYYLWPTVIFIAWFVWWYTRRRATPSGAKALRVIPTPPGLNGHGSPDRAVINRGRRIEV